jgi:hypothetical protein
MALTPALVKELLAVLRMQTHVHGKVGIMDMAYLALAVGLNGMFREQCQTVLLHAGARRSKLLWTFQRQLLQCSPQRLETVW